MLGLNVEVVLGALEHLQQFVEKQHALAAADIQPPQLLPGLPGHTPGAVGGAVHRWIVVDHDLAVAAQANVTLHAVDGQRECFFKCNRG